MEEIERSYDKENSVMPTLLIYNPTIECAKLVNDIYSNYDRLECKLKGENLLIENITYNLYNINEEKLIINNAKMLSLGLANNSFFEYLFNSQWLICPFENAIQKCLIEDKIDSASVLVYKGKTIIYALKSLFSTLNKEFNCSLVGFLNDNCCVIISDNKPFAYSVNNKTLTLINNIDVIGNRDDFEIIKPNGKKFYVFYESCLLLKGSIKDE